MKIAILVGDPEVQNTFLPKSRKWLQTNKAKQFIEKVKVQYKLKTNDEPKIVRKTIRGMKIYNSVFLYLTQMHPEHEFALVSPKEATYSFLNSFDIVFYNFYDPVAAAVYEQDPSKGKQLESTLFKLKNKIHPPMSFSRVQHDKCRYYGYLKKNGIHVLPFKCVTQIQWNKLKTRPEQVAFCRKILNQVQKMKWDRVFLKPVMGTSGTDTFKIKPTSTLQLQRIMTSLFRYKYPKVILQKYSRTFATPYNPEIKTYWIGNKYVYALASDKDESYGAIKSEKGTVTYNLKDAKLFASKVMDVVNKLYRNKPSLVTRIDVGRDEGGKYFLNEIEYAPSFVTSVIPGIHKHNIDKLIAKQMMNIIEHHMYKSKTLYKSIV
jgi:hypothetical protein